MYLCCAKTLTSKHCPCSCDTVITNSIIVFVCKRTQNVLILCWYECSILARIFLSFLTPKMSYNKKQKKNTHTHIFLTFLSMILCFLFFAFFSFHHKTKQAKQSGKLRNRKNNRRRKNLSSFKDKKIVLNFFFFFCFSCLFLLRSFCF